MTADARSETQVDARSELPEKDPPLHPKNVYRFLSGLGILVLTTAALVLVSVVEIQSVLGQDTLLDAGRPGWALPDADLSHSLAVTGAVTVVATLRLCRPRPRRILDTVTETVRSLLVVVAVVATIGYFDYSFHLPPPALLFFLGVLAVTLPPWFVALQRWQLERRAGTLVVGNNPRRIEAAVQAAAEPIVGYAFSPADSTGPDSGRRVGTDGGRAVATGKLSQYECLGGLSRLDSVLRQSNVGTVIPALPQTDRAEFFGVLETCHRHDVNVEILDEHNESVLVKEDPDISSDQTQRLIGINMQPLDLQSRLLKRLFDLVFAGLGLLVTLVLLVPIATAIKLDGGGPVFYRQERTTQFGDRFSVYKFRTMRPESESATPGEETDRVTRVGRLLRQTHLDEFPQFWAIFTGQMSVVGPRAAWTAEEEFLQDETEAWKKRWFVKPGLTGLAQINEVSSENSRAKLQYDLTYIRNQSFWYDLKIVVRQVWMVALDCYRLTVRPLVDRVG